MFRAFLFCSFYCFGNKLGTHNKGTLFSPEQRSANLEQTAPFVGSKLEHKVPSHVSQKEQLVLLGTKGPLQFKVLSAGVHKHKERVYNETHRLRVTGKRKTTTAIAEQNLYSVSS